MKVTLSITSLENIKDVVHLNNYMLLDYYSQVMNRRVLENLDILLNIFKNNTFILIESEINEMYIQLFDLVCGTQFQMTSYRHLFLQQDRQLPVRHK